MPKKATTSVGKKRRKHDDEDIENKPPTKKSIDSIKTVKSVKKISLAKGK